MKSARFFRGASVFPLVVLLLSVPLAFGFQAVGYASAGLLSSLTYALTLGLGYAGIPYALFLSGALLWSRRRSDRAVLTFTLAAPLLLAAVFFVVWVPVAALSSPPNASAPIRMALHEGVSYATACVVVGYAYVLLVLGAYGLLRLVGAVEPVAAPSAA